MNDLLTTFFNKSYENSLNEKLQELSYIFPKQEVYNYVKKIINLEIIEFLNWIDFNNFFTIDS